MSDAGPVTRALLLSVARRPRGDGPAPAGREVAEKLCLACLRVLDVDGAAVSLLTTSVARETLWASDPTARRLEELQFTLNEGICIQAAATGSPVVAADLADTAEVAGWPSFAASVLEQTRARALYALPLRWGATHLGVLDLYRDRVGRLEPDQWRDALAATQLAALLLIGAYTEPEPRSPADDATGARVPGWSWEPSVGNHAQVHQATGMVLQQLGVSATEALARMRAHAYAHDRLLIEVARDVVGRRLRFTPGIDDPEPTGTIDPGGAGGDTATSNTEE